MLIHLTHYLGHPIDLPLQNLQWGDTFAAGTLPDDISGVLNQLATFTVVTQSGATSNTLPAQFTAGADVTDLAYGAPGWTGWTPPFSCSMSSGVSDHDACEDQGSLNFPPECGGPAPWGLAPGDIGNLAGYHDSGWGFTGNSGKDEYWVTTPLKNGWVLDSSSVEVTTQVNNGGQASVDGFVTSDPGNVEPRLGVAYHVNNCGAIFYTGHMIVTGPTGVPPF